MLLPYGNVLYSPSDTNDTCRESLANGPVQVGNLLRSQNDSDKRGLVVGCSLSLYDSLSLSLSISLSPKVQLFPPLTAYL